MLRLLEAERAGGTDPSGAARAVAQLPQVLAVAAELGLRAGWWEVPIRPVHRCCPQALAAVAELVPTGRIGTCWRW